MDSTAMLIAAWVLLPAVALATWAWFAMVQVDDELRAFSGFEGMHFEIGPRAAEVAQGSRWPIPG